MCFFFNPLPLCETFKCWLLFTISYSKVLWADLIPDIESDSFSLHCQQIVTDEEMRWELGSASCQKVRASENLRNFSIKFRRIQTHQPCNDQTHHKKDLFATVYIPKGWVNRLATVTTFMITIVKLFSPAPRPIVPAARGRVGLCSGSRERAARSWIKPTQVSGCCESMFGSSRRVIAFTVHL